MKSMKPYFKIVKCIGPRPGVQLHMRDKKMNRKFKKWNIKEVNLTMY